MAPDTPHTPRAQLRGLQPGDLGWVISRHGALFARKYGFDPRFETLVARIAADFVDRLDPQQEYAWVAELDGQPAGCVFLGYEGSSPKLPSSSRLSFLGAMHTRIRGLKTGLLCSTKLDAHATGP